MDELLEAIRNQDSTTVRKLANSLFLTRSGHINKVMIDAFKKYAPCKFQLVTESDGFLVIGKIIYSDFPPFMFG